MKQHYLEYQNELPKIFPEIFGGSKNIKTITFQVTENCNLACSYCYEINKHEIDMTFETAKSFIDNIIEHRLDKNYFINEYNTKGLIIEFFGGEPLLNINLIKQITEYWESFFINHPECCWGLFHRYSICSNGTLYFEKEVQDYLELYKGLIDISITIDGCKEAHDQCRIFKKDGSPSYDLAIAAALDAKSKYESTGTKITLAPSNIKFIYKSITTMIELGFIDIHINCAFEEGWQLKDAQLLYQQFKQVSEYIAKNDLYEQVYIAMLDYDKYLESKEDTLNKNWCGTVDCMLALQPSGKIYSCCRFMDTSLGKNINKDFCFGHVQHGLGYTDNEKENINILKNLTTISQSEEKCLECPISKGCSYCTAYNYQYYNTFKRTTFICDCHKAAALATLYLCKLVNDKEGFSSIKITKDMAIPIIGEEEWNNISNFEIL